MLFCYWKLVWTSEQKSDVDLWSKTLRTSVTHLWFGLSECNTTCCLQGTHCEERLRIEIVNLKEQLEQRTEESGVWGFMWLVMWPCSWSPCVNVHPVTFSVQYFNTLFLSSSCLLLLSDSQRSWKVRRFCWKAFFKLNHHNKLFNLTK